MEFLLWMQQLHTPFLDGFFGAVTFLGDEILVVLTMTWFLWCGNRSFGLRLGMMFFAGGVTAQLLKLAFMVPRPWILEPLLQPGELAISRATGFSFPSGHTLAAAVLYGAIFCYARNKPLKALCVLAIALVSVSRLYLLVHTLQDVIVSLVLGLGIVALSEPVQKLIDTKPWLRYAGNVAALLLAAALVSLCAYRVNVNAMTGNIGGALSAAGATFGFVAGLTTSRGKYTDVHAAWYVQLLKMTAGLTVAGALLIGLPRLPVGHAADVLVYFMLAYWSVAVFPMLISKIKAKR